MSRLIGTRECRNGIFFVEHRCRKQAVQQQLAPRAQLHIQVAVLLRIPRLLSVGLDKLTASLNASCTGLETTDLPAPVCWI
jgi:hypothetical protein